MLVGALELGWECPGSSLEPLAPKALPETPSPLRANLDCQDASLRWG